MIDEAKLRQIKEIVFSEYGERLSEKDINALANELYYSMITDQYGFEDLMAILCDYEDEEVDYGRVDYVFGQLIFEMENGALTARRLYESFMHEYDLPDTYLKLVNENAEFLSEEQLEEVNEKALGLFGRETLKLYGVDV